MDSMTQSRMDSYIGTKVVFARRMTCGEAEKYLDRIIRSGKVAECGEDEGYLVLYDTGYQSWSPLDVFETAYRKTDGMIFGLAIEAAKKGLTVARKGNRVSIRLVRDASENGEVKERLVAVKPDDDLDPRLIYPWLADEDMLADDWLIVVPEQLSHIPNVTQLTGSE